MPVEQRIQIRAMLDFSGPVHERPYAFVGTDRLIEDFIAEVETWRSAH